MKHDFMNFNNSILYPDPMPGDAQMLTIAEDMEANGCTLAGHWHVVCFFKGGESLPPREL